MENKQMDQLLIELVKGNPEIYNMNHPNNKKLQVKEECWRNIGLALNVKPAVAKKRWRSIRDYYFAIKKSDEEPFGSAATHKKKKWKYFEACSFLDDVIQQRLTSENTEFELQEPMPLPSPEESSCEATPFRKRKFSDGFDDIIRLAHDKILETCQRVEVNVENNQSATFMFFQAFAKEVDDAALPKEVLIRLKQRVAEVVYEEIADHHESEDMDGSAGTSLKKSQCRFSRDEKYRLAFIVEQHPCIWDINDPNYLNSISTANAWLEIAEEMGKCVSVEDCKLNWASLCNSKRNRAKKYNCGDNVADINEPLGVDEGEWEFTKALEFLPVYAKKRAKLAGAAQTNEDCTDSLESTQNTSNNVTNTTSSKTNDDDKFGAIIADCLQQLVAKKLEKPERVVHTPLKHYPMWANMDSMIQRLHQETVNDLQIEFLMLINKQLKKLDT